MDSDPIAKAKAEQWAENARAFAAMTNTARELCDLIARTARELAMIADRNPADLDAARAAFGADRVDGLLRVARGEIGPGAFLDWIAEA